MMNQAQETHPFDSAHHDVVAAIPRVNIQAFCADEHTAKVMQAAAADRRLSKAHMDVQLGGIDAAVQVYAAAQTPAVLLVESKDTRQGIMTSLGNLAQVCDPGTRVIVIGHVNDVTLYRDLVSQGVSEYLVGPVHQLQVIEALASLFKSEKSALIGRIVAFVGAKGGVGSSTLAHNVALLVSKRFGIDTVITDLDLAFGTAGLNFNQDSSQGIAEALGASDRIDQVLIDRLLTKCSDRLSLLAAPGSIDRDVPVEAEALETILSVVRNSVPLVIVDMPNVWAPWTKQTLVQADAVVITATPELACLRNAKNLVDFLKAARPNDKPPLLILNQVGVQKRPEIPVAEFSRALGIEPSVIVPHDAQLFGTASSNGQMVVEVNDKSKVAEALETFAQLIAGREQPAKPGRFSLAPFLSKLPKLRKK
jgi:pilus assembly protein CpaE